MRARAAGVLVLHGVHERAAYLSGAQLWALHHDMYLVDGGGEGVADLPRHEQALAVSTSTPQPSRPPGAGAPLCLP